MTALTTRARELSAAAWATLEQLVDTFDQGGSFVSVADRAEQLLGRREQLKRELLRRANGGRDEHV